jgi:hypothetical protein
MTKIKKTHFHHEGRIRISVLIISLFIVAFFIFVGWVKIYSPVNISISPNQPPASSSTEIVSGNGSGTTSGSTSTTPPVVINNPTSTPSTPILPPISAQNIGHVVGIAAGGGLSKLSTSTLNRELDQMANLGVKWVRFDIEWGNVQYNSSSSFTWGNYDTLVNALVAHHLYGLGIVVYTPQWARTSGCTGGVECPPENPATFARFAAEVAARYKSDGMHYWEIWNEPNNYNFWATKTDCNAYAALLKVTYPAIKQADPNAVVITGGLAPATTDSHNTSPTDFLSCIYKNGGENYFDAVGDHPYSFPQMPSAVTTGAWAQMSEITPSLRSIMVTNGDADKKIWITEFGTPTDGPDTRWYITEAQQAEMVTNTFQLYKTYTWAGPFFWYTFQDSGTSTDTNENFFGLTRADESTKPAYATLQKIIFAGL